MERLKCEVCGRDGLKKEPGYVICEYCGTVYTPDYMRKILGAGKDPHIVKIRRHKKET